MIIWISKIVAVVALLGAASAVATPRGRLPLALRGMKKILRQDRGESAAEPEKRVAGWRKLLAFVLVIGAVLVAVV